MVEFLFLDLDDTILDFKAQEDAAIGKTLADVGIDPTQATCDRYSKINKDLWKKMELGEVTREQVLYGRFEILFEELGVVADAKQTALSYMEHLAEGHYFLPGAEDAVKALSKKYRLFITSNGTASVQNKRLDSCGIRPYFENIFISQDIGINKPAKGFFDYCFAKIEGFDPKKAMIVGDSPSSDIQGGQNAGITTCWVNPTGRKYTREVPPDYEITCLDQLENLLKTL
jgi:2-haloacid dehalogenase